MSKIRLGSGGYRGRPEGWEGDLGHYKNEELVKLGRAEYITKPKTKKRSKKIYRDKMMRAKN